MGASWRKAPASSSLAAVVPLLFLGIFVVWPLLEIMRQSLTGVETDRVVEVLSRASTVQVLWFTFWQAVVSTLLTLLVGLPIAHALARYRFVGRSVVRSIAVVPFVLPTVVVAASFNSVFERTGINGQRSLGAILGAHVFFNVAVIIRVVGGFWQGMDRSPEDAAQVLGASPLVAFRRITLPRLLPVISGAGLLVFLFSFTSFGVILILGGPRRATLETEVYRYAISRLEFDVAAVLALVQLVIVIGLSIASARFQRNHATASQSLPDATRLAVDSVGRRFHLGLVMALTLVVIGMPLASLLESSLVVGRGGPSRSRGAIPETGRSYGLTNYINLTKPVDLMPTSALEAVGTSLKFAAMAALVASVVGLLAAISISRGGRLGHVVEAGALVPLGVSAVTLGLGYLLAFTALDFRRSIWLVPLAHAVMGLPFVLAAVVPTMRSIDDALRQAGSALGASPARVAIMIEWPLLRGSLMTGAGFAAAISMGEFGATSFVSRGADSFTAPLAIFRLLSQPGTLLRGQALALSVVVGLIVAVIAAILERQRGQGVTLL